MTFVGKILVIVQVVLSVCFMAFATAVFTTHENWKDKYTKAQADLDQARNQAEQTEADLNLRLDELTAETKTAQADADRAKAAAQGLQQQLDMRLVEIDTLRTERDNFKLLADLVGSDESFRRDEAVKQRAVNETLHVNLDTLNTQTRALSDDIFTRKLREERILARYEDLLRQYADLRSMARSFGLDPDSKPSGTPQTPPPDVNGLVLDYRKTPHSGVEYVEISLGSNDGLDAGHTLSVYRTGDDRRYLGEIELVYVELNRAVGTVVTRNKNGIIQRGDNVSTKL